MNSSKVHVGSGIIDHRDKKNIVYKFINGCIHHVHITHYKHLVGLLLLL